MLCRTIKHNGTTVGATDNHGEGRGPATCVPRKGAPVAAMEAGGASLFACRF